jgi:hypothetical protein
MVLVTATEGSSTLELPVKVIIWTGATPPLKVTPSELVITRRADHVQTESLVVESGGVPLELKLEPRMAPDSCTLFATPDQTIRSPQPLTPATVTVGCYGEPGDYSGSIRVTAGSNSVVVPVSVHISPAPYSGTITPPVIGSVVNAASGRTGALAPGEIITIHGSGVGTRDPAGIVFDTSGGVTRSLNGLRVVRRPAGSPDLHIAVSDQPDRTV